MYNLPKKYNKYINIYKSRDYVKLPQQFPLTRIKYAQQKVITFDLDETLGSFGDLYILWMSIQPYITSNKYTGSDLALASPSHSIDELAFFALMDLYPEFLRHGILNILDFLYYKKLSGDCSKICLYTNNQCSQPDNSKWISLIITYITRRICNETMKMPLFDKIICAFKIDGQIIEPSRTTQNKTYNDLIKCTLLPKTAEICFIDNSYYKKMMNDRVYYIQPKSYQHSLSTDEIIERFISNWTLFKLDKTAESKLYDLFLIHGRIKPARSLNDNAINVDLIVSQKIMYYLKEFFLLTTKKQKTKKISLSQIGRFTRKSRTSYN